MASQTKLLLIPCSGEETQRLAHDIFRILREDYSLESQVELLDSHQRKEIDNDTPKAHRHQLVGDYFADEEVQVDIGSNELKDVIRGKHLALIEHMLTPARKVTDGDSQNVSVNDHVMTIRGFLDVVSNVETLQRTLVAPYLAYVRSHSVEKYQKRGFYQFDSLHTMLMDFQKGGLNAIACIDPHSTKAAQLAEELNMDFHASNPFQSGRAINPYKLGLAGEKTKEVLKRLRPFQERFDQMKQRYGQRVSVISVDDGTERRAENFTERAYRNSPSEEVYQKLAYLDKDRIGYEHAPTRFKQFSQINERNIDPEGVYIIIDDMFASGSTSNTAAQIFKSASAKRVEVWTSHAVTMPVQQSKANDRSHIDKVVCLDTVPQHPSLEVEYIPASADLLAAELYKAHQKLMALR